MSHPMSFVELDGQHVELLLARTVLSMFSVQGTGGSAVPGGPSPDQVTKFVVNLLLGGSATEGSAGSNSSGAGPS